MAEVTIIVAFIAGIVSFLAPCVLPLLPGFIAYLSGTTLEDSKKNRKKPPLANPESMLDKFGESE